MSNDKWCHKKVALRSFLTRAITHCSTEELLEQQLVTIKEIAKKHGYSVKLVTKLYKEICKRQLNNRASNQLIHKIGKMR